MVERFRPDLDGLRRWMERKKDLKESGRGRYHLIVQEPGSRGRTIAKGSLDELREQVRDMAEAGELLPGSLAYVTVNRYGGSYGGGIYEGYYVDDDGQLVKGYRKTPWRMSRGGFSKWAEPWYEGKVPPHATGTRTMLLRMGCTGEEYQRAMEEAAKEDE